MMNKDTVKRFVEGNLNLISKKETSIPGVYVLKYKNKCFYDSIWNETIENTRGAVIDSDYNLIANPFRKIYNYGIEKNAPKIDDDEMVTAIRKVNGFMLAVSLFNDDFLFSTTGSIDSKYAEMGKEIFWNQNDPDSDDVKHLKMMMKATNSTYLYECVHPDDPHIIPEDVGVYYLGHRKNEWDGRFSYPKTPSIGGISLCCGIAPEILYVSMKEIKEKVKTVNHEGYVIYTDDGRATKIKSPYYLVKKFLARCNKPEKLLDPKIKQNIEEEYYPLVDKVQEDIKYFTMLSEQDRLKYIRTFIENM